MMRSLWAGVTGLQAHQIAMDVEGNNIANVNTVGFKYSRANFDDLIYQTSRIATGPQNRHGGVNSMQVGLGVQTNSTTRIFKQGSLQTTDKQTDIALQGDGFFMVSPDGGKTTYYTRNGDFSRDSVGNFVDNGGNIVQGWMRDEVTGEIDPTRPIGDIKIPSGLTVPARATTNIALKGNLDSGNDVGNKKIPIYQLDQHHNWTDTNKDGIKVDAEKHEENNVGENRFYVNKNGEQKMTERGADLGVLFNKNGDAYNLRTGQGIWASYADAKTKALNVGATPDGKFVPAKQLNITLNGEKIVASVASVSELASAINERYTKTGVEASVINGNQLVLTNRNNLGTTAATRNIKMTVNPGNNIGNDFKTTNIITAYQYIYNKTQVNATHTYNDAVAREVTTTEDLREAMQRDARLWTNYTGTVVGNTPGPNTTPDPAAFAAALANNKNDGVEVTVNEHGQFQVKNPSGDAFNSDDGDDTDDTTGNIPPGTANTNADANDHNMNLTVTGLSNAANNVTENVKFTASMAPLSGSLSSGNATRVTDSLNMAAHSSSTDLFDSLGTKHNIKIDFVKRGYTPNGGTEWTMVIQVAEPNRINPDGEPANVITGYVRFNPDGSLATYSPASITFGAQNGSAGGQHIELKLGTTAQMDGLASTDNDSSTADISQDGYASGELNGIRIDQSGTLVGSFTNGRSLGLAQVGVAKFSNNEGLSSEGGNLFSRTANSGDPVIGAAQTAGRGKISSSSLEMSNVDLSRSLTQLIVVQRGFQANSKTITTSDEMLNTLLQLK
ncbi:flagellar hook protein FlgE [Campylobacter rectus RM3267]|uniref:Flagellar hook protein FlgE n=3 Tax=Campylobacter rectus TaxID=203 RepID=A0A6G5QQT3_CAMRE|nr:flagellar hook protein FlgE [Campylobacter rectus]EEF15292.1 flagellar hook protein FlgE [Campylobacter rectus RM3267]QCD47989.1 flagellar hook protein, epsilonproteobacterial variant [Campylobacter rectus]UEB48690.1 flagellar hook protein FlgE [Campylobacter rectus]